MDITNDFLFVSATMLLDFIYLGIDQCSVPPALQESPNETDLAVKASTFKEIAIAEVGKRPPKERLPCIAMLFHALYQCLWAYFFAIVGFCRASEVKFDVKQVNCLAYGIVDVFVAEPREIVQVVVTKVVLEFHGTTLGELYVFVHQPLFAHPLAIAEHPQQFYGIDAAAHPLAHEYVASIEDNSSNVARQPGQFFLQFSHQLRHQVFVGIKPQHPPRGDIGVFQPPIELFRIIVFPAVLEYMHVAKFTSNFKCTVGRKAVDDKNFLRKGCHILQASADV